MGELGSKHLCELGVKKATPSCHEHTTESESTTLDGQLLVVGTDR